MKRYIYIFLMLVLGANSYAQDRVLVPKYRINNGGVEIASESGMPWSMDTQDHPCEYMDSLSSNNTAGGNSFATTNSTDAPDEVLGSYRRDGPWLGPLKYHFPVPNGKYQVSLYFAELPNAGGYSEAGKRVFSVDIEGARKLTDLDMYAEAQANGFQKKFDIEMTDGMIDIDFIANIGNPQINGIEIAEITNGPVNSARQLILDDSAVKVYPNPVKDVVSIDLSGIQSMNISVAILDITGRRVYETSARNEKGVNIDLNGIGLNKGLFFIKVTSDKGEKVLKVIKL